MTEKISRSEQKRLHKQIEDAAKELVALGSQEVQRLPCSSEMKKEIAATAAMKGGARKRQIKYVAKLIKQENPEEILRHLQEEKGSKLEQNRFQHLIERIRDTIVNEALELYEESRRFGEEWEPGYESSEIEQTVARFPEIDEMDLRRAAYQYAKNRNKVYYRELFRLLKAAAEKRSLVNKMENEGADS